MKDLDVIEAQLSRILSFFPRVDTKIAGLFTVDAAILTLSALNLQVGDLRLWYVALPFMTTLALLTASFYHLYKANFPDLKGGEGSLIYFNEIQKRTEAVYHREFLAASDDAYRADMLGQIWRQSQILCDKYRSVAHAIRFTLAALLPFAVFLSATAIEHSRVPIFKG